MTKKKFDHFFSLKLRYIKNVEINFDAKKLKNQGFNEWGNFPLSLKKYMN